MTLWHKAYAMHFEYYIRVKYLPRALIPSTIDIIRLKLKLEKSNMFFQQAFINMQVTRCISGLFVCIWKRKTEQARERSLKLDLLLAVVEFSFKIVKQKLLRKIGSKNLEFRQIAKAF